MIDFKSEKNKKVLMISLMVFFSIVFLVSSAILINELVLKSVKQDQVTQKIQGVYDSGIQEKESMEDTFKKLQEINPDIKGWIYIPNTTVNYPVLEPQKNDPSFYLYRDYEKNYTKYGSIFVDAKCGIKEDTKNTIIHGHHMRDGKMFADILKYGDIEFYKTSPVITFNTIYGPSEWKVISVFKTNINSSQGEIFDYLKVSFANDSSFLNYVHDVRQRSIINAPVDTKEDDQLLTLSTCSDEMEQFRTVVVARKVRNGESNKVDVEKSCLNPAPLYPEAWYTKYGGTRPEEKSFEQALSDNEIYWYSKSEDSQQN